MNKKLYTKLLDLLKKGYEISILSQDHFIETINECKTNLPKNEHHLFAPEVLYWFDNVFVPHFFIDHWLSGSGVFNFILDDNYLKLNVEFNSCNTSEIIEEKKTIELFDDSSFDFLSKKLHCIPIDDIKTLIADEILLVNFSYEYDINSCVWSFNDFNLKHNNIALKLNKYEMAFLQNNIHNIISKWECDLITLDKFYEKKEIIVNDNFVDIYSFSKFHHTISIE